MVDSTLFIIKSDQLNAENSAKTTFSFSAANFCTSQTSLFIFASFKFEMVQLLFESNLHWMHRYKMC